MNSLLKTYVTKCDQIPLNQLMLLSKNLLDSYFHDTDDRRKGAYINKILTIIGKNYDISDSMIGLLDYLITEFYIKRIEKTGKYIDHYATFLGSKELINLKPNLKKLIYKHCMLLDKYFDKIKDNNEDNMNMESIIYKSLYHKIPLLAHFCDIDYLRKKYADVISLAIEHRTSSIMLRNARSVDYLRSDHLIFKLIPHIFPIENFYSNHFAVNDIVSAMPKLIMIIDDDYLTNNKFIVREACTKFKNYIYVKNYKHLNEIMRDKKEYEAWFKDGSLNELFPDATGNWEKDRDWLEDKWYNLRWEKSGGINDYEFFDEYFDYEDVLTEPIQIDKDNVITFDINDYIKFFKKWKVY